MNTIQRNATSKSLGVEPLVLRPNQAMHMLDCDRAYLYELINSGEIESYLDGAARKITVKSIHARIERKIHEAPAKSPTGRKMREARQQTAA